MSQHRKIQATKNYRLFARSADNRPTDIKRRRALEASMKKYGFLPSFPIVCSRDKDGHLIVKDGQHRLALAETLSLPVYWTEEPIDFDIAVVNSASKIWAIRDYAQTHAANGSSAYQEGLDFADAHRLPIGTAFALLGGMTGFTNIQQSFIEGKFVVRDRRWANAVAGIYSPLVKMSDKLRNARLIEACMALCRVEEFDPKRLLHGADQCRDKLVSYSTREAYLLMLEEVYNFRRTKLVALKTLAMMAMKDRNPALAKKKSA